MLLVQKIFYYHFATWMAGALAVVICGVASAVYLFKGTPRADRIGWRPLSSSSSSARSDW
jgi:hypothetical protein